MSNFYRTILVFTLVLWGTSCAAPIPAATPTPTISPAPSSTLEPMPTISISRYPDPADFSNLHEQLMAIPTYDPKSAEAWQVDPQIDLRSQDLTNIDMTNSLFDLMAAAFDSKTQWPTSEKLPAGFDPQEIMEIGKDPGLGIHALHEQGITGKGIGIAVIDQTLLVDHVEYKDRIRVYGEISDLEITEAETSMHGAAVASLAVGKTIGVAPEADLYYIEAHFCNSYDSNNFDYSCLNQAIKRVVDINRTLPADRKIRVLSLSQWSQGIPEINAAIKKAEAAGIFVISPGLYESLGFHFEGMGRAPLSDPNQFESFLPAPFWAKNFYQSGIYENILLMPMDSRTAASPTGVNDYVFYRWGDISWTIPYLAGVYALAAQVKTDITPEVFWEMAMNTGKTIQIQRSGKEYELGVILDPQALIDEALRNK